MRLIAIIVLTAIAVGGCSGWADPHWQTNPYGAKQFWEDRDRRGGGSAE